MDSHYIYYPYPPTFQLCDELQLHNVSGFFDDLVSNLGDLTNEQLLKKNPMRICSGQGCAKRYGRRTITLRRKQG